MYGPKNFGQKTKLHVVLRTFLCQKFAFSPPPLPSLPGTSWVPKWANMYFYSVFGPFAYPKFQNFRLRRIQFRKIWAKKAILLFPGAQKFFPAARAPMLTWWEGVPSPPSPFPTFPAGVHNMSKITHIMVPSSDLNHPNGFGCLF